MLRSAFWILQMAYLLLQPRQQAKATEEAEAKEVEKEAAKKRVTRVSVACQAALDEDMNKVLQEGDSLAKGFPECPIVKGLMKTQGEEEEDLEKSAEPTMTAAEEATNKVVLEEATREVALMKAALEEDMKHYDKSLGYGSDCSSLVDEEQQGQPKALEPRWQLE